MTEYWDSLPEEKRAELNEISLRYVGLAPSVKADGEVPDFAAMQEMLELQHVEIEVTAAYGKWLERLKTECEQAERRWTQRELQRMAEEESTNE